MPVKDAAALMGVSEDTVRRWIDANEPDAEHPDRVPVAERTRGSAGPVAGSWRRPFRDAVLAEARRRGRPVPGGGGPAPTGDVTQG